MEKETIYLYIEPNGMVTGWGSNKSPEPSSSEVEIEIESNHEVKRFPTAYRYSDGVIKRDNSHILEQLIERKIEQLNNSCKEAILGRFKSVLNDIEYEFSYDMEAQSRFNGVPYLFTSNIITEVEWNAYLNGERTSILLDKESFDKVAADAFAHQMSNITKFRHLVGLLNSAITFEEVSAIAW
jgi:hypothetical protein